jgi:hypothetical protein
MGWPGESPVLAQRAASEDPRWTRAVGDSSGLSGDNINKQAWKDHLWSLPAALPAERRVLAHRGWVGETSRHFEHPARVFYCGPSPHYS